MNQTLKTVLVISVVIIVWKVLDRLFLDAHVWNRVPSFFEEE